MTTIDDLAAREQRTPIVTVTIQVDGERSSTFELDAAELAAHLAVDHVDGAPADVFAAALAEFTYATAMAAAAVAEALETWKATRAQVARVVHGPAGLAELRAAAAAALASELEDTEALGDLGSSRHTFAEAFAELDDWIRADGPSNAAAAATLRRMVASWEHGR